jgi:hypothetical protein
VNRALVVLVEIALAACTASCATAPKSIGPTTGAGYGESMRAAIEVCSRDGERAYLARLVCPAGDAATFDRLGTPGTRNDLPADRSVSEQVESARRDPLQPGEVVAVDAYEVACGASKRVLYLDMYHCHQPAPTEVPPGYTLQ